jgi:hypothetical protein
MLPQNEESMDEHDLQVLKEARECQERGESLVTSLKDPSRYQPYIDSLIKSLIKREAILGRYNHVTAQSYAALGNVYIQMEEQRAVVMYRACFRIHTFLYGKCNGQISGEFKDLLFKRGLTQTDIEEVRTEVMQSMKHEMEGDLLRRFGDKKAAVLEYQKAARLEEFAFGRDNPDLAYLWRKMACLTSIKKGLMSAVDYDEADRIGNRWMKQVKESLSPSICASIRRGDRYYEALLYSLAVGEYLKATTMDGVESRKVKPAKNKDRSTHHKAARTTPKKTPRPSVDVTNELHMLLAGKLPKSSSSQSQAGHPEEQSKASELPQKTAHSTPGASPIAGKYSHKRPEAELVLGTGEKEINKPPLPPLTKPEESASSYTEMASEMLKNLQQDVTRRELRPSSEHPKVTETTQWPSSDSSVSESSRQCSEKPKGQTNLVVSSSTFPKKQRQHLSESSLYQAIKRSYAEPKKPKSLSSVSKFISKTSKIAKRQLKRTSSLSSKDKPKSESSFFSASARPYRTTVPIHIDDNDDDKQKSTSYLLLASPPKTPSVANHRREAETFWNLAVDADSLASFDILDSPQKASKAAIVASQEDSIADSKLFESSSPAQAEKTTPRQTEEEPNEGLGKFLSSKEESNTTPLDQRSLTDQQSVMTSDDEIRQRFLSETALMANTMEETEPSLVELVAHIQTMSGLLQRQTFRLQNKLGDQPSNRKTDKRLGSAKKRVVPEGTKELCGEVEGLFQNCDETLAKAFARLDDGDSNNPSNQALEDYRKTFTLEKVFLEQLRRGVLSIVANNSAISMTLDEDARESIEVDSSSSGLFHRSEVTSTLLNESEGSFFEESILSIVFEDHSSKSPSDQPKPQIDLLGFL